MNGAHDRTDNPAEQPARPAQPAQPAQPTYGQYAQAPSPAVTPVSRDPRSKSPALASFLSVVPGLGQIYVGYYQRGFTHALVVIFCIVMLSTNLPNAMFPLFGLFMGFFWLYNIIDAGRRAALFNEMLAGGDQIELPKDFNMPGLGGSITGGAALIAVGFILLTNTLWEVPLDWLERWWPMGLIVFGGILLFKAIQERVVDGDSK